MAFWKVFMLLTQDFHCLDALLLPCLYPIWVSWTELNQQCLDFVASRYFQILEASSVSLYFLEQLQIRQPFLFLLEVYFETFPGLLLMLLPQLSQFGAKNNIGHDIHEFIYLTINIIIIISLIAVL